MQLGMTLNYTLLVLVKIMGTFHGTIRHGTAPHWTWSLWPQHTAMFPDEASFKAVQLPFIGGPVLMRADS